MTHGIFIGSWRANLGEIIARCGNKERFVVVKLSPLWSSRLEGETIELLTELKQMVREYTKKRCKDDDEIPKKQSILIYPGCRYIVLLRGENK